MHASLSGLPKMYRPRSKHPTTGDRFTRCVEFEANVDIQRHRYMPPTKPTGVVVEYGDDDEIVSERKLTPVELAKEVAVYEKARAAYARTGGVFLTQGPTTITGRFATEAGDEVSGIWSESDKRWIWTEYMVPK